LLGLIFNPEDGGDMILRNVGWCSADYNVLYPRRQNPFNPRIFPCITYLWIICGSRFWELYKVCRPWILWTNGWDPLSQQVPLAPYVTPQQIGNRDENWRPHCTKDWCISSSYFRRWRLSALAEYKFMAKSMTRGWNRPPRGCH
jgi:hypothetical protein